MGMGAATAQAQIAADVLRRAASSPSKSPWTPARDAEETLVDPHTRRIMKPSLSEYHVPVHADIPPIDVRWHVVLAQAWFHDASNTQIDQRLLRIACQNPQ